MQIKHETLIMVADGRKMQLYRNDGNVKNVLLTTIAHEEGGNEPTRALGTDTPGRTQANEGTRRSEYAETDWHDQSEEGFARRAADTLEQAVQGHAKSEIAVIAAPKTLGTMRKYYGPTTKQRLTIEIPKDLASHIADDVIKVVAAYSP